MKQFALVVVISTLVSLLVSFTLTPMLASRFSRLEHFNKKTLGGFILISFENAINAITAAYVKLLKWAIRKWWAVLGLTTII
ncbi:efflux RND transporter permease subunit, partial [bacterium]|nr:efflux RND transporter permease subunit [bacterium]